MNPAVSELKGVLLRIFSVGYPTGTGISSSSAGLVGAYIQHLSGHLLAAEQRLICHIYIACFIIKITSLIIRRVVAKFNNSVSCLESQLP